MTDGPHAATAVSRCDATAGVLARSRSPRSVTTAGPPGSRTLSSISNMVFPLLSSSQASLGPTAHSFQAIPGGHHDEGSPVANNARNNAVRNAAGVTVAGPALLRCRDAAGGRPERSRPGSGATITTLPLERGRPWPDDRRFLALVHGRTVAGEAGRGKGHTSGA